MGLNFYLMDRVQNLQTRGVWNFDASMSKTFRIAESKSVQIRMDATNVLKIGRAHV